MARVRSWQAVLLVWSGVAGGAPGCQCLGGPDENVEQVEAHAALEGATDFGDCSLGRTCRLDLFLMNDGEDPLDVRDGHVEGAAFDVTGVPEKVAPGGTATLGVRFKPSVEGAQQASLVILSNASDHPELRVTLLGNGTPADLVVEPGSLDFGQVDPGGSRSLPLTLRNRGQVALSVTLAVGDDAYGSFRVSVAGHSPVTEDRLSVPAGGSVPASVRFAPSVGGDLSGTLRADFCGEGCGTAVALQGSLKAPRLDLTPLTLDFGHLPQGGSAELDLSVSNRGNAALSVQTADVTVGSGSFSVVTPLPVAVEPGALAPLRVRFQAPASGRVDGQLRLGSNDTRTPQAYVDLTGGTSGMDVVVLPAAVDFGMQEDGEAVVQDVVIFNRGDQAASLEALLLTGDAFALPVPPAFPSALTAGSVLMVSLQFQPPSLGTFAGSLEVVTDSPLRPRITVPLTGRRGQRSCDVSSTTDLVAFGGVRVGQQSQRVVTLRNVGTGSCLLHAPRLASQFTNDSSFTVSGQVGVLDPGYGVNLVFHFSPRQGGAQRAIFQVDIDGVPPVLVTNRGSGLLGEVSVNPGVLDFGAVAPGCGSTVRRVTVMSQGSTGVQLDPPRLAPGLPFAVLGSLPGTLAPGLAQSLELSFTPSVVGRFSGELTILAHLPDPVELRVGLTGVGSADGTPVTDTFLVDGHREMDVLFVVDNSGSMADNQARLADNMARFMAMADFRGEGVDYHLGITTTDVTPEGAHGQLVGSPAYLTRGASSSAFSARAVVGVNGSGWEQGLEAAALALSPALVLAGNRGFLRDQAGLALVFVSDEEDQSPYTVDQYLDFFRGLKSGGSAPVVLNAITGGPSGCVDENAGDFGEPSARYSTAAAATGGIWASICAPDWGESLEHVGEAVFLARGRFTLSSRPIPSSIAVEVDNQGATGWTYDALSNQVVFDRSHLPAGGSSVTVNYLVACGG